MKMLKRSFFKSIIIAGLAVVAGACSQDGTEPSDNTEIQKGTGYFKTPNVAAGLEVDVNEVPLGRAVTDLSFIIDVIDTASGETVTSTNFVQGDIIEVPVGEGYVAQVRSAVLKDAAFESPYYKGESEVFNISDNYITEIAPINLEFLNIKVSVVITDRLSQYLGDATVTVTSSIGEDATLVFTKEEYFYSYNEDRVYAGASGYFRYEDGETLTVTFAGIVDGAYVESKSAIENPAAGEHRILYFGIKDASGDDPQLPVLENNDEDQEAGEGDDIEGTASFALDKGKILLVKSMR